MGRALRVGGGPGAGGDEDRRGGLGVLGSRAGRHARRRRVSEQRERHAARGGQPVHGDRRRGRRRSSRSQEHHDERARRPAHGRDAASRRVPEPDDRRRAGAARSGRSRRRRQGRVRGARRGVRSDRPAGARDLLRPPGRGRAPAELGRPHRHRHRRRRGDLLHPGDGGRPLRRRGQDHAGAVAARRRTATGAGEAGRLPRSRFSGPRLGRRGDRRVLDSTRQLPILRDPILAGDPI